MTTSRPGRAGRVLHLAERGIWAAVGRGGEGTPHTAYTGSTRGLCVDDVGFVHLSTATQLPAVMAAYYADVPAEDLVLLVVDLPTLEGCGVPVRWEDVEGADQPFPHAYGPLPRQAVVAALDLAVADDGRPAMPDLTGLGVLTGPPDA